jgi:hypothetical protein
MTDPTSEPQVVGPKQRYAALLMQAKGRRSLRDIGEATGLPASSIHDIVRGAALPSAERHEQLVRHLIPNTYAPGSHNDQLMKKLEAAYLEAAGMPAEEPRPAEHLLTLGPVPLWFLSPLLRAIDDAMTAAGYTDRVLADGGRVMGVAPTRPRWPGDEQ